jgi:hypothetical protein
VWLDRTASHGASPCCVSRCNRLTPQAVRSVCAVLCLISCSAGKEQRQHWPPADLFRLPNRSGVYTAAVRTPPPARPLPLCWGCAVAPTNQPTVALCYYRCVVSLVLSSAARHPLGSRVFSSVALCCCLCGAVGALWVAQWHLWVQHHLSAGLQCVSAADLPAPCWCCFCVDLLVLFLCRLGQSGPLQAACPPDCFAQTCVCLFRRWSLH